MPLTKPWEKRHNEAKVKGEDVQEKQNLHVLESFLILEVDYFAYGLLIVVGEVVKRRDQTRNKMIIKNKWIILFLLKGSDFVTEDEGLKVDEKVLDFVVFVGVLDIFVSFND
jgi:hypothetical protein